MTTFSPPFLLHAKKKGSLPRSAMDGTCNAVMSAGVFTINDYRTEGLQQLRALPDKLRAAERRPPRVKVRWIEGWADGAKGWFVDASLILIDVHTPQQMRCVSK